MPRSLNNAELALKRILSSINMKKIVKLNKASSSETEQGQEKQNRKAQHFHHTQAYTDKENWQALANSQKIQPLPFQAHADSQALRRALSHHSSKKGLSSRISEPSCSLFRNTMPSKFANQRKQVKNSIANSVEPSERQSIPNSNRTQSISSLYLSQMNQAKKSLRMKESRINLLIDQLDQSKNELMHLRGVCYQLIKNFNIGAKNKRYMSGGEDEHENKQNFKEGTKITVNSKIVHIIEVLVNLFQYSEEERNEMFRSVGDEDGRAVGQERRKQGKIEPSRKIKNFGVDANKDVYLPYSQQ